MTQDTPFPPAAVTPEPSPGLVEELMLLSPSTPRGVVVEAAARYEARHAAEIAALQKRVILLESVLKRLEWACDGMCLYCNEMKPNGHSATCRFDKLVNGAGDEPTA